MLNFLGAADQRLVINKGQIAHPGPARCANIDPESLRRQAKSHEILARRNTRPNVKNMSSIAKPILRFRGASKKRLLPNNTYAACLISTSSIPISTASRFRRRTPRCGLANVSYSIVQLSARRLGCLSMTADLISVRSDRNSHNSRLYVHLLPLISTSAFHKMDALRRPGTHTIGEP